MVRGAFTLILGLLLLVACTSASPVRTLVPPPEPTESTASSASTVPEVEVIAPADVPLLATFLAAVNDGTAGTSQEGVAFEDPEGVIRTAVLFCDLLDQGLTIEEVMIAYIGALNDGEVEQVLSEAELRLGGVILGAGVETICPEFRDRLDL